MSDINKAYISFRIGIPHWKSDAPFENLLRLFEAYKGVTDEITFFTSETHAPLPLETMRTHCEILKRRMAEVRKLGYRTGINHLPTMGHHEENLPNSLSADYQKVMDANGKICRGCFCPNDKMFLRDYITPLYEMIVAAGPDYIWIDDDVRMAYHSPVALTCFCDNCLEIFANEFGVRYTRESLQQIFDAGSESDKLSIRKKWLQHNRNTVTNLLEFIEKIVHAIEPDLPLGFMNCAGMYEGMDSARWAKVLAGPENIDVYWRPGGGVYTEECLDKIIAKAHAIGRDVALLPAEVLSIQSEIECFPYERLGKSTQAIALEAAVYIAAGCTGAAYNVLPATNESLNDFYPLVKKLHATGEFLDKVASTFKRVKPCGIFSGWCKDIFAVKNLNSGRWLFDNDSLPGLYNADEIYHLGLPVAYGPESAQVIALNQNAVEALDDDTILNYLSRGVYMDGGALEVLNRRGYGEYTGFQLDTKLESDTLECLMSHPLNGRNEGIYRDCRQSFWWNDNAYNLVPHERAENLSCLMDYNYDVIGKCGSGVFDNSLGGRICVSGYFPWSKLQFGYKTEQFKNIMRWLSRDTLTAYIASYHRISIWDRILDDGRHAVAIVNCYLDPAENVELVLRTHDTKIVLIDTDSNESDITSCEQRGEYAHFILPRILPWQCYMIVNC